MVRFFKNLSLLVLLGFVLGIGPVVPTQEMILNSKSKTQKPKKELPYQPPDLEILNKENIKLDDLLNEKNPGDEGDSEKKFDWTKVPFIPLKLLKLPILPDEER